MTVNRLKDFNALQLMAHIVAQNELDVVEFKEISLKCSRHIDNMWTFH